MATLDLVRAGRSYDSEGVMPGLIRQLFDAHRTVVPTQTLPTEGWRSVQGVGRMSLVWPWFAVEDTTELVDSFGRDVGVAPLVELHAPRSDSDVVLIVWREAGGGPVAGPQWAVSIARFYGGRLQANAPIALGGAIGHLARVIRGQDVCWRIIVPREGSVVQIEVAAPSRHAAAYWLQIESMLATWAWDC